MVRMKENRKFRLVNGGGGGYRFRFASAVRVLRLRASHPPQGWSRCGFVRFKG